MNSKTPVQDENFLRKLFETFQTNILRAIDGKNIILLGSIDKKNDDLLESIDKKNYDLRSDIAQMKDEIVGELETARQEQTMLSGQHSRVIDHEERLEKLEKIHPQGLHVSI